jgi:hypothetical protein
MDDIIVFEKENALKILKGASNNSKFSSYLSQDSFTTDKGFYLNHDNINKNKNDKHENSTKNDKFNVNFLI